MFDKLLSCDRTLAAFCLNFIAAMDIWTPLSAVCASSRKLISTNPLVWKGCTVLLMGFKVSGDQWNLFPIVSKHARRVVLSAAQAGYATAIPCQQMLNWQCQHPFAEYRRQGQSYGNLAEEVAWLACDCKRICVSKDPILAGVPWKASIDWMGNVWCVVGVTEGSTAAMAKQATYNNQGARTIPTNALYTFHHARPNTNLRKNTALLLQVNCLPGKSCTMAAPCRMICTWNVALYALLRQGEL